MRDRKAYNRAYYKKRKRADPEYLRKNYSKANKKRTRPPSWYVLQYSIEEYEKQLLTQDGGCAICGVKTNTKRNFRFAVDHDHATNKIRGLLCNRCNTSIERLETIPDWTSKAKQYLDSYN